MNLLKQLYTKPFIPVFVFFGILYSTISLVNHYYFRTFGFDLGIINNSIWDYAHFRWNSNTVMQPSFDNILSDHFSLLPILISPLYWLLGSYTLLIVQIIGILWGGFGIYKLVLLKSKQQSIAILASIHFFSIWGIYTALGFDYHDNVLAAAFVPFFFYYLEMNKWKNAIIYFILILISKENMALWMVFICIGAAWLNSKDFNKCKRLILLAIVSGLYMGIVIKYIIPSLGNADREYLHFHYAALGTNMKDAFLYVIKNPYDTFLLLFNDPSNSGGAIYKKQLHIAVFLSGGVFLLFRPQYLIMLLPIYAQKLFSDDMGKWGITAHYCIEFAPVLVLVTYDVIQGINSKALKIGVASIIILSTMYATYNVIENQAIWWQEKNNLHFYRAEHFENREVNIEDIHKAIDLIPSDAVLSAQSNIVPHVAFRDKIYQYPAIEDAEYVLLLPEISNTYPLSKEDYVTKLNEFNSDKNWEVLYKTKSVLLLRKVKRQ